MKRIWMYIAFTFFFSWFIAYGMMAGDGLSSRWATVLVMVMTVMPALANALTRLLTKEGFRGGVGAANMHLAPKLRGKQALKIYALAWVLPIAAVLAGAALYYLTHPSLFDAGMEYYTDMLADAYGQLGRSYTDGELQSALWSEILLRLLFYPCLNFVMCLGAELGWRGYLLPHLEEKYARPTAVLITGVVWGIWYGPLIEMGQYYGTAYTGYPYVGMLVVMLICVAFGCFLSWLLYATGTVAASAIASAVFTSLLPVATYFCASSDYNTLLGPAPVGLIGGAGILLLGVVFFCKMLKKS